MSKSAKNWKVSIGFGSMEVIANLRGQIKEDWTSVKVLKKTGNL